RFADGRSLQVEASWVLAQEEDHMGVHLYGTAGGASLDDNTLHIYTVGEQGRVRTSTTLRGGQPAVTAQAADFVRAGRGEQAPRTPAAHGVQLMALLDAIYRSAKDGYEVTL